MDPYDPYGTLMPPPRRRSWLRVAAIGLGGVLLGVSVAAIVYGLAVLVLFTFAALVMNNFGSNK